LSYRYLEHATDAIIEVEAPTLEEAFVLAGKSVVDTILDSKLVEEKKRKHSPSLEKTSATCCITGLRR